MKTVIISLTRGGKLQALRIRDIMPEAELYVLEKFYEPQEATQPIYSSLRELVEECFLKADLLIFIMATGIVVRLIAPLLQHKGIDPAVLVMDEGGKNIISLVSGHVGGANLWTKKLGEALGANPVITTASDSKGLLSIDMLAIEYNCALIDWEKAKKITSHMVNGGSVGVYSDELDLSSLPPEYIVVKTLQELKKCLTGVCISNKQLNLVGEEGLIQLYPKNIVVGIGCKLGTKKTAILEEIEAAFNVVKRSIYSIKKVMTIEIKAKEAGLIEATQQLKVPLEILATNEIKQVEGLFEASAFVEKTVGVSAVSGPCAYIGSHKGKILLEKQRNNGVTISLAEMNEG